MLLQTNIWKGFILGICFLFLWTSTTLATTIQSSIADQHTKTMKYLKCTDDTWNDKDMEAFPSLSHPGYSLASDPVAFTGGWWAHRAALQPIDGVHPPDWIHDEVADKITKFDYHKMPIGRPPKILVLYGSIREQSFSRMLAYEFARLLELLGCDVRVYNPRGLPIRDPDIEDHIKVQELRALTH